MIDVKTRTKGEVRLLVKRIVDDMDYLHRAIIGRSSAVRWDADLYGERPDAVMTPTDMYIYLAGLLADCNAVLGKKPVEFKSTTKTKPYDADDDLEEDDCHEDDE